jgi:hypothetical protein
MLELDDWQGHRRKIKAKQLQIFYSIEAQSTAQNPTTIKCMA